MLNWFNKIMEQHKKEKDNDEIIECQWCEYWGDYFCYYTRQEIECKHDSCIHFKRYEG